MSRSSSPQHRDVATLRGTRRAVERAWARGGTCQHRRAV